MDLINFIFYFVRCGEFSGVEFIFCRIFAKVLKFTEVLQIF